MLKLDLQYFAQDELAGTWLLNRVLPEQDLESGSIIFKVDGQMYSLDENGELAIVPLKKISLYSWYTNFVSIVTTADKYYSVNAYYIDKTNEEGWYASYNYNNTDLGIEVLYRENFSDDARVRQIVITSKLAEVENGSTLLAWLKSNAVKQAPPVTIEYDGLVVATVEGGNKATIPVADKKMKTDIVITVPENSSEVLPEFTEIEDFTVMVSGLEGEMEISYDVSEKVALPSGYNQLTSVNDTNFIASNIKKGVSIFDLVGAYEAETIEEYDGTIVIEDIAPEEEKVNITLKADNGGGNTMCSTYVKFGEAPSSNYDSEYFCMGGALDIKQGNESSYGSYVSLGTDSINITVNPVAYIWVPQTDNLAGYKLNGGSLINVGTGYANATEVQLSEGDVLTILSTWLD